jgi:hypothetical protein
MSEKQKAAERMACLCRRTERCPGCCHFVPSMSGAAGGSCAIVNERNLMLLREGDQPWVYDDGW